MKRLEVSGAVRPIYGSLGVKRLILYWEIIAFLTKHINHLAPEFSSLCDVHESGNYMRTA